MPVLEWLFLNGCLSLTEGTGRYVEYDYDDLYRLLSETVTDPINGDHFSQWAYDAVGNRLQQEIDGIITLYTYNDNDHLLTETKNSIVTRYDYDDNGNTLTKTIDTVIDTTYSYSKDNRMLTADTSTSSISYSYDAGGIRQSQTVNGQTINYLVDPNRSYHQVLEEQDDLFMPQVVYTYGDDLISQTNAQGVYTFGYDGLGSTRILTDVNGTVQNSYGYQAFGELDYQYGAIENNYLFTGEQYDNNVGFYYLRARYYNPGIGRFQNMDTFPGMQFEPKTLHKYLYTHADPINNVDPSGYMSLGSLLTAQRVNAISNAYAVADIGFRLYVGGPGAVAKDIVLEVVYAKFGGAYGKRVSKLGERALGLYYRIFKRGVGKLKLGKDPSSSVLTHNLNALKIKKPSGSQAHHIVGQSTKVGKDTQRILKRHEIDLNSTMNGVFLPGCKNSKAIGMIHCGRHTKEYEDAVFERIFAASHSKESVINALTEIRNELLNNTFKPLNKRAIK